MLCVMESLGGVSSLHEADAEKLVAYFLESANTQSHFHNTTPK